MHHGTSTRVQKKILILTRQAEALLQAAQGLFLVGDFRGWRSKVLESYILINHAYKLLDRRATADDEIEALAMFQELEAAMERRINEALAMQKDNVLAQPGQIIVRHQGGE